MSGSNLIFDRPVGAAADLAELEYVSALHQTSPKLRLDGSIDSADISSLLLSRFGVAVSPEDIENIIFQDGLSCGGSSRYDDQDNPEQTNTKSSSSTLTTKQPPKVLDLSEIVAALLVPELIRAANSIVLNEKDVDESSESKQQGERSSILIANDHFPSDFSGENFNQDNGSEYQPYLQRWKRIQKDLSEEVPPDINVVDLAFSAIIEGTFGKTNGNSEDGTSDQESNPTIFVTKDTVRAILRSVDDHELAEDKDLVQAMVDAATHMPSSDYSQEREEDPEDHRGPVPLDVESFARALVADVAPTYRLDDDASPHSIFRDVFGYDKIDRPGCGCCPGQSRGKPLLLRPEAGGTKAKIRPSEENDRPSNKTTTPSPAEVSISNEEESSVDFDPSSTTLALEDVLSVEASEQDKAEDKAKSIFTAPSIDYTSDAHHNKTIAVLLWVFFLLHVLASGSLGLQDFPSIVPTDMEMCPPTPDIPCDTLEIFLTWVDRIVTLVLIGGIVIMGLGSIGNRAGRVHPIAILLSMIPTIYFFAKPFTSIGTGPSDLKGSPHRQFALGTSMFVALILIVVRLKQLVSPCLRKAWLPKVFSKPYRSSEAERKEAASHKTTRMLVNAAQIAREVDVGAETSDSSLTTKSLIHFYEKKDQYEVAGGYFWSFRSLRSREIYRKEGILFSGRLLAANIMQFAIIIYIILFVLAATKSIIESYENSTIIIFVRTGQSIANSLLDRLSSVPSSLSMLAQKAIDTIYSTILPAIEAFQIANCATIFAKANYTDLLAICSGEINPSDYDLSPDTVASLCSSRSSLETLQKFCTKSRGLYSDMAAEAESFKALAELTAKSNIDSFRIFLQSFIDSGFQTISNYATIVDPIEPWMLQMAFGIGGLVAFLCAIFLATLYIPSVASTTLKFRSGVIPSLRDPLFSQRYREATYTTTYLTGALFWGALIYCAGIAFVLAIVIIVLCWIFIVLPKMGGDEATAPGIWGRIIGSVVAFLVQWILFVALARCAHAVAYYRKRPAAANIYTLLWEASWIGTSIFFVATRVAKLIVAAALQAGRVDVPFLADGVGKFGPVHLDRFPMIFRTDILQHEAHRHPYIERLCKIYLMKIRDGREFLNAAGTTWRVIFVLSLMPWLRQHRFLCRYGDEWKAKIHQAKKLDVAKDDNTASDLNKEVSSGRVKAVETITSAAAGAIKELLD